MSDKSDIEWTDATWNPVRGCEKVSPGCKHCYAETFAERFRGVPGHPYEQGFDPRLVPASLGIPLGWKRSRTIFVNSMSDLFADFVPNDYIAKTFAVMALSEQHTFQVLTKRAERLLQWSKWAAGGRHVWKAAQGIVMPRGRDKGAPGWPLPNVWLGVSVEDRKYGVPRIDYLRRTPAAVRFLSIEPLLEDIGTIDLTGIGWVIVGGESGRGARPMEIEWVRSIRDQCVAAGVPFFFKQWGGVLKKKRGRELDGRTWDEMPARAVST